MKKGHSLYPAWLITSLFWYASSNSWLCCFHIIEINDNATLSAWFLWCEHSAQALAVSTVYLSRRNRSTASCFNPSWANFRIVQKRCHPSCIQMDQKHRQQRNCREACKVMSVIVTDLWRWFSHPCQMQYHIRTSDLICCTAFICCLKNCIFW